MTDTVTLTIDGKAYTLPVVRGTEGERAIDISKLREQTGLAVSIADDSLSCVALGTGKALEYEKQLRHAIDYDS